MTLAFTLIKAFQVTRTSYLNSLAFSALFNLDLRALEVCQFQMRMPGGDMLFLVFAFGENSRFLSKFSSNKGIRFFG